MKNTFASFGVGLALVGSTGGLVFWQNNAAPEPIPMTNSQMEPSATNTDPEPSPASITAAEVATHNSRESCWTTINSNVYDLTSWIPKHPGGEQKIVQLCGTDGSAKFNKQHGGMAQQASILAGFKIGAAE